MTEETLTEILLHCYVDELGAGNTSQVILEIASNGEISELPGDNTGWGPPRESSVVIGARVGTTILATPKEAMEHSVSWTSQQPYKRAELERVGRLIQKYYSNLEIFACDY